MMKKQLIFTTFLIIIAWVSSMTQSCLLPVYNTHIEICVENNSDDTIFVYPATGDSYFSQTKYPDTLLPRNFAVENDRRTFADIMIDLPIAPHTMGVIWGKDVEGVHSWDHQPYRKSFKEIKLDTLSIFFICADSLHKFGYDYVAENNKILMRYDLSVLDMESLYYRIPYPPKDNMKKMKIWKSED